MVSVTLSSRDIVPTALGLLAPLTPKEPVVDNVTVELTVENGPAVGAEVLRALDAAQIPSAASRCASPASTTSS